MDEAQQDMAPPPYTIDEAEASSIIGRLENIVDAIETDTDEVRSYIVKQLKNFLLFVLSVDYQCNTWTSLRWIDREHFATINNTLLRLRTVHNHQPFSVEERSEYCAGMGTFLEEPCKALAIPIEHVAKTILDYFKYQNHAGAYQGSTHELYRSCGADALAQKILRDSQVLIPRLASSTDMADEMCDALDQVSTKYFQHIAGAKSSIIGSGSGSGKGKGCTVVQSVIYTLSERGEAYEAARASMEAKRRQQRGLSSKHWAKRIEMCVRGAICRKKLAPGPLGDNLKSSWHGPSTSDHNVSSHVWDRPPGWLCGSLVQDPYEAELHIPDFYEMV
ncbi:hypothetical protein LTS10_003726 [Elasticomyces elasticus]|nr:hypothetical protein LTS10_003726 [Elasticomyces elasticus]